MLTLGAWPILDYDDDPDDLDSWRAAIRPNTKAFFAETISNPQIDVLDIPGVSGVAHEQDTAEPHPARSGVHGSRSSPAAKPG